MIEPRRRKSIIIFFGIIIRIEQIFNVVEGDAVAGRWLGEEEGGGKEKGKKEKGEGEKGGRGKGFHRRLFKVGFSGFNEVGYRFFGDVR
jgi:hypothetical protein